VHHDNPVRASVALRSTVHELRSILGAKQAGVILTYPAMQQT
jgi:DNA-binding SARP family transcriptional activator